MLKLLFSEKTNSRISKQGLSYIVTRPTVSQSNTCMLNYAGVIFIDGPEAIPELRARPLCLNRDVFGYIYRRFLIPNFSFLHTGSYYAASWSLFSRPKAKSLLGQKGIRFGSCKVRSLTRALDFLCDKFGGNNQKNRSQCRRNQ